MRESGLYVVYSEARGACGYVEVYRRRASAVSAVRSIRIWQAAANVPQTAAVQYVPWGAFSVTSGITKMVIPNYIPSELR